jgi:type II secretory pathway component GspD/PulD (secretin)
MRRRYSIVDIRNHSRTIRGGVAIRRTFRGITMSRIITRAVLIVFVLAVSASTRAADPPPAEKRGTYTVKHGSAKELATVLTKHFKNAVEFLPGPEGSGNIVLFSAPPALYDEVVPLLEKLDRRPQKLSVVVLMGEFPIKKGEEPKELDEKEFSGLIGDVTTRLQAREKKGELTTLKRFELNGREDQLASLTQMEQKPYVTGSSTRATGITTSTIRYQNVGTNIRVTPRINDDKDIVLELNIEDARAHQPPGSPEIGKDDKGDPILATEVVNAKLEGKVSIRPGRAVLLNGVKTNSKSGTTQTFIIVGARVVDADK